MIVAFFESIKYVGHLLPLAVLRIFLGTVYLEIAMTKMQGTYLVQPELAGRIHQGLDKADLPTWYQGLMESVVIPYWQVFAYFSTVADLAIGIAFLIGFLVRPLAIIASIVALNLIFVGDPSMVLYHQVLFATTGMLAWMGAGRCLGIDYFFFKRNRGIWW